MAHSGTLPWLRLLPALRLSWLTLVVPLGAFACSGEASDGDDGSTTSGTQERSGDSAPEASEEDGSSGTDAEGAPAADEVENSETCGDEDCVVGALGDSPWAGMEELEQLSQNCMGSHTERTCVECGVSYVQVGGFDGSAPFYDAQGHLVAVQVIGQGTDGCADAWYGANLSGCAPQGREQRVYCDNVGP